MSTKRKASRKAGAIRKSGRKAAMGSFVGQAVKISSAATSVYYVKAPAGGKMKIQATLREKFGGPVDVEEVRDAQNKVLIRQASPDELASWESSNIEQEFAVRKALLAKARPIEKVRELLDIKSRQTLHNWISQSKIIALPENGRLLLPLWQFEASTDDKLVPGFSEVLRALNRNSFSAAHWFTSPNVQLGNKPPIALLRAGEITKVVAEAKLVDVLP